MGSIGTSRKRTETFSPREQTILTMAGEGLADKEIARKIGITVGTVRTYWQRMREKTDARNRSEVISLAFQRSHSASLGELQRQTSRFLAIFEASAVGLALLDERQEIVEVNAIFAEAFCVTPCRLIGLKLNSIKGLTGVGLVNHEDLELVAVSGARRPSSENVCYQLLRQRVELNGENYDVVTLLPLTPMPNLVPSATPLKPVLWVNTQPERCSA